MRKQLGNKCISYDWLRGIWTVGIASVTIFSISIIMIPLNNLKPVPNFMVILALLTLLVMVLLRIPNRWFPGGLFFGLVTKWSRLVVMPALLIAASSEFNFFDSWRIPPGAAFWPLLMALGGITLWCILQLTFRPPALFFLLKRSQAIRVVIFAWLFHLFHNGLPEEIFFRVILQTWLVSMVGFWFSGVIVASLIFGFLHLFWKGNQSWGTAIRNLLLIQAPLGALLGTLWYATFWLPGIALCHAFVDTAVGLDRAAARFLSKRVPMGKASAPRFWRNLS
ncbi:MAG: CPBP family intramembrane metalloprotease [Firmicutes bacterium]|nr:CPBP family intramembrane metalloprotease [Bacillota bacterium]